MKEDETDKACGMHGEEEKCIKCSGGKPEGKRLFAGLRHRWEYKISIELEEIDEMVCTGFIWLMIRMWTLAITVMNMQVP